MDKSEFKEIIDDWIGFHGKKFHADSEEISAKMYKRHLQIYYEAVSYMSAKAFDNGFKQAVKIHKYYPKPAELLKFCPAEKKAESTASYKPLPMSEEAKKKNEKRIRGHMQIQDRRRAN